jgi:hypothetical protein
MKWVAMTTLGVVAALGLACSAETVEDEQQARTVRARVQMEPGGELEEVEMEVHPAVTELEIVSADEAELEDEDLVLGVFADGRAVAYPIRFLALYEVANDRVGNAALAPTW